MNGLGQPLKTHVRKHAPLSLDSFQPSPADLQAARELFAKAEKDEDARNWESALDKLQKAGAVKMTPGIRVHMARCEENLARLTQAADDYIAAMTQARAENNTEVFNMSLDALVQLRPRLLVLEDAQRRQLEGVDRMEAGDPHGARNAFAQAYALYPSSPKILWNLSLAEEDAGERERAARHLHVLMASKDPYMTETKKAAARKRLERVREKLGAISVTASPDARVTIDGLPVPEGYAAGDSVEFEPGIHTVRMEAAGRKKETNVTVKAGETIRIRF